MAHEILSFERSQQRRHLFDQIVRTLDRLPPDVRKVFVAAHYTGKSPAEIAVQMGVDEVDVRCRLRQAESLLYSTLRVTSAPSIGNGSGISS